MHGCQSLTPSGLILALDLLLSSTLSAREPVFVGNVPLPPDAIEADMASSDFAGTWVGKWDGMRNHILIIEEVRSDGQANVIYAVGSDLVSAGRWFRRQAKIRGKTLTFADDGFPARYTLSSTGRVRGVYDADRGFAVLKREALDDVLASPNHDWFTIGYQQRLPTSLTEDGKRISLTVVTYSPPGDGPFPLALIHHGSTGSGTNPKDFDLIWTSDWLADVLNEHGWYVAFPYRRGRGLSDGTYDEGFAQDRRQGYSLKAERSLPGAERALTDANAALAALKSQPQIDAGPILVGGISRGGVVAIMQAGNLPDNVAGVLNFVGGWIGSKGDPAINPTLFRRIGAYKGTVLSIYGEEDPYYSIEHSRANLSQLEAQGAQSDMLVVKLPGYGNGHWVLSMPSLWENTVDSFLTRISGKN